MSSLPLFKADHQVKIYVFGKVLTLDVAVAFTAAIDDADQLGGVGLAIDEGLDTPAVRFVIARL
ncbi:hypothetical protein [Streptomyces sp. NPDC058466]|uniref:hypothetical protein n=1 Tax=Streptomyces sp. NPDC058466 TaxID=3346512 RepID=UPI003666FE3A